MSIEIIEQIEKELIEGQQQRAKDILKPFDKPTKNQLTKIAKLINDSFYNGGYSESLLVVDVVNAIINSSLTADLTLTLIESNINKLSKNFKKHEKALRWLARQVRKGRKNIHNTARKNM